MPNKFTCGNTTNLVVGNGLLFLRGWAVGPQDCRRPLYLPQDIHEAVSLNYVQIVLSSYHNYLLSQQ